MKVHPIMLILTLALLGVQILCSSHNYHISTEVRSHTAYFNRPCCLQIGGKECGHIWKGCCVGECRDVMMVQYCDGKEVALPPNMCSNSCVKQCESKGGMICGASVIKDSCCAIQNCNGISDLTRTCAPGS